MRLDVLLCRFWCLDVTGVVAVDLPTARVAFSGLGSFREGSRTRVLLEAW
jgi:hypothetical protein